jgi:hypothetical protein
LAALESELGDNSLVATLDAIRYQNMSLAVRGITPYVNNVGPAIVTVICLVALSWRSTYVRYGWDIVLHRC